MSTRLHRLLSIGVDGWQFAAVGLSLIAVTTIVVRTAQSLQVVASSKAELELVLARTLANGHAREFVTHVGCSSERVLGRFRSEIECFERGGSRHLGIRVGTTNREAARFECEVLDGALPPALRRPLTLLGDVPDRIRMRLLAAQDQSESRRAFDTTTRLPRVDREGLRPTAISAAIRAAFRCDAGVAFRHSRVGTDRRDYVLQPDPSDGVVRLQFGPSGVLQLNGNLWLEPGSSPLLIELEQPGTLLVYGNVYFGTSVKIVGPDSASLVVFAMRAGGADWVESSGCVSFGLQGMRSDQSLQLDLSIVVEGALDLVACGVPTEVAGPLVVGGDVRLATPDAALFRATGRKLPDSRMRQPAVVVRGGPRPGRLWTVPASAD